MVDQAHIYASSSVCIYETTNLPDWHMGVLIRHRLRDVCRSRSIDKLENQRAGWMEVISIFNACEIDPQP